MLNWQNINRKSETGRRPEGSASASDAGLVRAARRGDKKAFVEIVARYQAMVCGVALGILGEFAASEDAGQEAFLTAALGQLRRTRGHELLDVAAAAALVASLNPSAARTEAAVAVGQKWFPNGLGEDKSTDPAAVAWLASLDAESARRVVYEIQWQWGTCDAKRMLSGR